MTFTLPFSFLKIICNKLLSPSLVSQYISNIKKDSLEANHSNDNPSVMSSMLETHTRIFTVINHSPLTSDVTFAEFVVLGSNTTIVEYADVPKLLNGISNETTVVEVSYSAPELMYSTTPTVPEAPNATPIVPKATDTTLSVTKVANVANTTSIAPTYTVGTSTVPKAIVTTPSVTSIIEPSTTTSTASANENDLETSTLSGRKTTLNSSSNWDLFPGMFQQKNAIKPLNGKDIDVKILSPTIVRKVIDRKTTVAETLPCDGDLLQKNQGLSRFLFNPVSNMPMNLISYICSPLTPRAASCFTMDYNNRTSPKKTTKPSEDISCTTVDAGESSYWSLKPGSLQDMDNSCNCNTVMDSNNMVETIDSSKLNGGSDLFRIMVEDSMENLTWAIEALPRHVLGSTSSTATNEYSQTTTSNMRKLAYNVPTVVVEEPEEHWPVDSSSPKPNLNLVRALAETSDIGEDSDWSVESSSPENDEDSDENCNWETEASAKPKPNLNIALAEDLNEGSDWSLESAQEDAPKLNLSLVGTRSEDSGENSDWSVESVQLNFVNTKNSPIDTLLEEKNGLKLVSEPTSQGRRVLARYGLDAPSERDDYWTLMYDYLAQKSPQH
eukprot:Ihof_evm1s1067 gene=Ihof_evmTU1s1067